MATSRQEPATGGVGYGSQTNRGSRVSPERVVELVDARRRHSQNYNATLFGKLQGWYYNYRGYWQGRHSQFRNNISFPFTFAMIQSDVARKVQTVFGTWPIVEFEGYAPEDVAIAKKNTMLISAQMRDCDSVLRSMDLLLQADICGTGIARIGWKRLKRLNRITRMESIAPGMDIPVRYEEEVELYNGPTWETVDRLDFWQQPGKTRIDDMAWVIHRYWLDYEDLLEDAHSDYPYFDATAVRMLKDTSLGSNGQTAFLERRVTFRNEYDYQARQNERFAKPVQIWEMHGLVPEEFAEGGLRHRCIAIGNERVVLKNGEGPMPNQRKPFRSVATMMDPYSFDGIGKAEIASGPQQTANRLANQKLDAIDLIIDPMYVASDKAQINTQNLFTRAGRVLLLGDASEEAFRPLTPNIQGVQLAYQEIAQMFQFMQLGTGETDALMGQGGGRERETARGFLGRQENALTRLAMETKIIESFAEGLADDFRTMDRVWLPLPKEVNILGSMATVNPTTGLPYPPERVTVGPGDLSPDYRARAVGASQMMNRSVRQQNLLGLFQMMSANPAMMQLVNWANFARQAFELFDFKNVNELLVNQVPMVNALAANNGMAPEQVAGAVSQPLDQLSPEVLGQLMGGQTQPSPLGNLGGL